jgi:hypothetical protein
MKKSELREIIKEEILKEAKNEAKMVITGRTINVSYDDVDEFAKFLDKYKIKYSFPAKG